MMKSLFIGTTEVRQFNNGYRLNDLQKEVLTESKRDFKEWLKNKSTLSIINALASRGGIPPLTKVWGGKDKGTYVCKQLVYSYAMWISPDFYLLVVDTFDSFVNAETVEEIKELKYKLDNAKQQDFFAPERQPRDEKSLQVILKCTPFQAEQFHNELIRMGEIEVDYEEHKTIRIRKFKIGHQSTCVTGINKSGTLQYDTEELKKKLRIYDQIDWTS